MISTYYTTNVLSTLADTYLKASDVEKWESTYLKIFELEHFASQVNEVTPSRHVLRSSSNPNFSVGCQTSPV